MEDHSLELFCSKNDLKVLIESTIDYFVKPIIFFSMHFCKFNHFLNVCFIILLNCSHVINIS